MKIVRTERVSRYLVRFTADESAMLRAVGLSPPDPAHGAEIWATRRELASLDLATDLPPSFRAMIRAAVSQIADDEWRGEEHPEPSAEALAEMPEIDDVRFRRRTPSVREAHDLRARLELTERALRDVLPVVALAERIGLHWRTQSGVSGALLDELARMTEPE